MSWKIFCFSVFLVTSQGVAASLPSLQQKMQSLGAIPLAQWPSFVPGEGILEVSENRDRQLQAKYGQSAVDPLEFAPLKVIEVQRMRAREYRVVYDPSSLPSSWVKIRHGLLAEEQFRRMKRLFSERGFGNLRPHGIVIADQEPGNTPIPSEVNDPLAQSQPQQTFLSTYVFWRELGQRPNPSEEWTVAVLDTGFRPGTDARPPDSRSRSFVGGSAPVDDRDVMQDKAGHSSRITEIIAGTVGNARGGHGVISTERPVWVLKVMYAVSTTFGTMATGTEIDVLTALDYMQENLRPGEKVVANMSFSFLAPLEKLEAKMEELADRVLFITSAGNIGQGISPHELQYPGIIPVANNLCVTGLEVNGLVRSAAKRGKESRIGALACPLTSYGSGCGTSYAVPQVVAVSSKLGSENRLLGPVDVIAALLSGGPRVQTEEAGLDIRRLNPVGALAEVRKKHPLPKLPTATLTLEPNSVALGGEPVKLRWSSTDGAEARIDPFPGAVGPRGEILVSTVTETTFTLTVKGEGGIAKAVATLSVQPEASPKPALPPAVPAPPPRSRRP